MKALYLGRALRTNETLPDFLKWRWVTRHPLVFRGLTGSQRTPGNGASHIGLGVPSIALLLDFFSMKESVEGFLYIAKRSNAKLIISDLPSSHKHWKERYFFVGGHNWEYNSADREDTLGIPTAWTASENLRELPFAFNWV